MHVSKGSMHVSKSEWGGGGGASMHVSKGVCM